VSRSAVLARVIRSGVEESTHVGHVAVCDADGRLMAVAGDPDREVFARSCLKPLQAAVALHLIDEELTDREIAVICSSHNAEPVHLRAVHAVLQRAGLTTSSLRCPPAWPLDPDTMVKVGRRRRELHDCSGKHAGMLLACVCAGYERSSYLSRSHPLQRRIRRATLAALDRDDTQVGIDGCGAPVFTGAVRDWATLFARLGEPDRFGGLADAAELAVGAMLAEPYLVGGRDRLDTDVMSVTGRVLVKEGAEALTCASVPELGLGIAVKAEDGGDRAVGPALIRVLRELGAITRRETADLVDRAEPLVLGGGGAVGEVVSDLSLRRPR
jgi:L-asparaginase II